MIFCQNYTSGYKIQKISYSRNDWNTRRNILTILAQNPVLLLLFGEIPNKGQGCMTDQDHQSGSANATSKITILLRVIVFIIHIIFVKVSVNRVNGSCGIPESCRYAFFACLQYFVVIHALIQES